MTIEQARMLSTALTQFIENAGDPEDRSADESADIATALKMLDEADAMLASVAPDTIECDR